MEQELQEKGKKINLMIRNFLRRPQVGKDFIFIILGIGNDLLLILAGFIEGKNGNKIGTQQVRNKLAFLTI